jgi:hypothetical protein
MPPNSTTHEREVGTPGQPQRTTAAGGDAAAPGSREAVLVRQTKRDGLGRRRVDGEQQTGSTSRPGQWRSK